MKLDQVFPSNFLKAGDLQGRDVPVTIRECKIEKLGEDQKLVTYFAGKEKGLVTNRTNADRIAHYHGNDTDGWVGKQILLGTELVTFQGKTSEALRVKGIPRIPLNAAPVPTGPVDAPFDDEPGF